MGLQSRFLEKVFQLDRNLANEFRSCRQFLNGEAPKDNNELMHQVLNKAIPYTLSHSPLMLGLVGMSEGARTNGTAKVHMSITPENWDAVQKTLKVPKLMLDEGDMIAYCLKFYMAEVKLKRCLP